jgi:uncharacterized protein (TIGR02594 family)
MHAIIDSPYNLGKYAAKLALEGVQTVIRYYNFKNSETFPEKCLTRAEASQLISAGLSLATVYQQRAGAGEGDGHIEDFTLARASRDAQAALQCANRVGQPAGSAIYFSVDHDFARTAELQQIRQYFAAVQVAFAGHYRLGVYGSGAVCRLLKDAGICTLFWVPRSMGWTGTKAFLASNDWTLFQFSQELSEPWGKFDYDANKFNTAFPDFGQFAAISNLAPAAMPLVATTAPVRPFGTYQVIATGTLNVRGGPGTTFPVIGSLASGAVVHGYRFEGDWLQVDLNGDGRVDGFVKATFVRARMGGAPLPVPAPVTPYAVAKVELNYNVAEFPGTEDNNPRISLYHSLTSDGVAPDETAWCSSFANYCVTQAGGKGTNSKWARSWHDSHWCADVTASPREGDIVVFSRVPTAGGPGGGHVAFLVEDLGSSLRILGGNQSNKVCEDVYPRSGTKGPYTYQLLSIRR